MFSAKSFILAFFPAAILGSALPVVPRAAVQANVTSVSVLSGTGCPPGTYTTHPIFDGVPYVGQVGFDSYFTYSPKNTKDCVVQIGYQYQVPSDGKADLTLQGTTDIFVQDTFETGDMKVTVTETTTLGGKAQSGSQTFSGLGQYFLYVTEKFTATGTPGSIGTGTATAKIVVDTNGGTATGDEYAAINSFVFTFIPS